jgi:hypothetical protein
LTAAEEEEIPASIKSTLVEQDQKEEDLPRIYDVTDGQINTY